jgi:pimeloyl-ACP methyl ester carboxylesterase
MISSCADAFFGHFLDIWTKLPGAIPADLRAAYLKASREAVASIVADYRASATIDIEHDQADRQNGNRLHMPVAVLHQDAGTDFVLAAARIWRAWAPDMSHTTLACGHFMAEEAPAEIIKALRNLLAR